MLTRILVGIDGSTNSLRALQVAIEILERKGPGTLTLVYVGEQPSELEWFKGAGGLVTGGLSEVRRSELAALETATLEGQKLLEEARTICLEALKDDQLRFETLVLFGDPGQTLIEYSQTRKYDLMVLGSRGAGPIKSVFLGSVSQKILNGATCPVLIVK